MLITTDQSTERALVATGRVFVQISPFRPRESLVFRSTRHHGHRRPRPPMGSLPAPPQLDCASYDIALLAFIHLYERIEAMPEASWDAHWQRVSRTLATLPGPDPAELLALD